MMKHLELAPILLLLLALGAGSAPVVAQGIPDYIPDEPGEPLIDRERERMEERYRGFLSRFFATGGFDVAPFTGSGLAYQTNVSVGMNLNSGDALLLSVAQRSFLVPRSLEEPRPDIGEPQWYFGAGYEVRGTRFFGHTPLGQRSALVMGAGVLTGDVSAVAFEVAPTYDLFQRDAWSLPVGVKLNVAMFSDQDVSLTRAFLGLHLGVRWRWVHRDRLD